MSKPNKYQKQLSEAIQSTRADFVDALKTAQAARTTALGIRDQAAQDNGSAFKEMVRNEQMLAVASRIEEMTTRTQLLAGNLTIFANDFHTDSEEAQAAMAEAAAAIKNAAGAMELLTEAVHTETAVTKSRDKGDAINDQALLANAAVDGAMTAVNHLQTQSLKCSIIAATPLAGSVAQSFSVMGDQVGSLVTDITQARDVARQEVAATTTRRNQTWNRFYKTIKPFERPLQVKTGRQRGFEVIDKLANFGLKVQPSNQAPLPGSSFSVDQQGRTAGLLAQVVLPVETMHLYQVPVFYAVKELDAATFKFATGSIGCGPLPTQETNAAIYQAQLLQDNKGTPLSFGTSYCIFMKQDLQEGAQDSPPAHLPRYSLPSQPILATYSQQKLLKPTVLRLLCGQSAGPADPLLVAFTLPAPPPKGVNYRMIIIPSKQWEAGQENEEYLIERASPSDYVDLDFKLLAKSTASEIQQSLLYQYAADLKAVRPAKVDAQLLKNATHQMAEVLDKLTDSIALASTALVYYSSAPSSAKSKFAQFGYYSDMSGEVITLNHDRYQVGVLAWQNNPDGPYVGSLVGRSDSIGTPPPCFDAPGRADDSTTTTSAA